MAIEGRKSAHGRHSGLRGAGHSRKEILRIPDIAQRASLLKNGDRVRCGEPNTKKNGIVLLLQRIESVIAAQRAVKLEVDSEVLNKFDLEPRNRVRNTELRNLNDRNATFNGSVIVVLMSVSIQTGKRHLLKNCDVLVAKPGQVGGAR